MSHIRISDLQPSSTNTSKELNQMTQTSESEVKKIIGGSYFKPLVIHTDRWIVTFCPDGTISHGSTSFCPTRFLSF